MGLIWSISGFYDFFYRVLRGGIRGEFLMQDGMGWKIEITVKKECDKSLVSPPKGIFGTKRNGGRGEGLLNVLIFGIFRPSTPPLSSILHFVSLHQTVRVLGITTKLERESLFHIILQIEHSNNVYSGAYKGLDRKSVV